MEPDATFLHSSSDKTSRYNKKFAKLNQSLAKVIEDFSLVRFNPLDINDEESINDNLMIIDNVLQYGEDLEVKEPKDLDKEDE